VAVLLRTASRVLMFDTGDSWGTRGSRFREVVLPALEDLAPRVDLLLLPSLDEDRARSAALMMLDGKVDRLVVGGGWPGSATDPRCREQQFHWDEVAFQIFEAGRYCLLRVAVPGASVLLAGDLDAAAERRLLARVGAPALASDAVLVGRRVSASASSAGWIESLSPGLVIASGGIAEARARIEVLDRWRRHSKLIVDTRRVGGVRLLLDADGVRLGAAARDSRFPFAWRRP
jgi:competence protein ComEC